jgi:hypothetical protein
MWPMHQKLENITVKMNGKKVQPVHGSSGQQSRAMLSIALHTDCHDSGKGSDK